MRRAALVAAALACAACGPRTLELGVAIDVSCRVSQPAGSSLLYEVTTDGVDGGAPPRVCGACIDVTTPVTDAEGLLALLRKSAPACPIARDTTVRVRLTGFSLAACRPKSTGEVDPLCARSGALAVGGGGSDQRLEVAMACPGVCDVATCTPLDCAAQGKDCGTASNGCAQTLDCGTCKPPQKCGGGGTPNVCGK